MSQSLIVTVVTLAVWLSSVSHAYAARLSSTISSTALASDDKWSSKNSGRSLHAEFSGSPTSLAWFRDTITDGYPHRHVILKRHLDDVNQLTSLPLINGLLFGTIGNETVSIQGQCEGAPAPKYTPPGNHAAMLPLKPGQCVIVVDTDVMEIVGTKLWINNIYFRFTKPRAGTTTGGKSPFKQMIKVSGEGAALYMTNVTMQGNGDPVRDCNNCAFQAAKKSRVYAKGVIVSDMDGERGAQLTSGSTASIMESEFKSLNIWRGSSWYSLPKETGDREYGSAAIEVDAEGSTYGNTLLRYEKSNIAQVTPTGWGGGYVFVFPLMRDERGTDAQALIYGDDWVTNICWLESDSETENASNYDPPCSQRNRLELSQANQADFLSLSDPFPTKAQEELKNGRV